jgi:FkbM family methyltransferase
MPRGTSLLLSGLQRAGQNLVTIAASGAFPSRRAVLRVYLPMLARQFLAVARPSLLRRSGAAKLFGHAVRYGDYGNFVFNFEEMFIEQQYAFSADSAAPRVLDCGANMGLSVLYVKLRYPGAQIVAFEPSPETFPLLEANAGALPGVRLEQKALAGAPGELTFYGFPGDHASLRATTVAQAGAEPIATVEATPLSRYLDEPVDLLKLDVEGRELEILQELASSGRLGQVERMLIEAHHHESFTENRLSTLLALLEDNGFAYRVRAPQGGDRWAETAQDVWLSVWRRG